MTTFRVSCHVSATHHAGLHSFPRVRMHPIDAAQRRLHEQGKPVEIGDDVRVGSGAIILPGVRIGLRAVIGAGSVVTRDVPEGVFAARNPCRVIWEIEQETDGAPPARRPLRGRHGRV